MGVNRKCRGSRDGSKKELCLPSLGSVLPAFPPRPTSLSLRTPVLPRLPSYRSPTLLCVFPCLGLVPESLTVQGMVLRLRESTTTAPSNHGQRRSQEVGRTIAAAAAAASADDAPYMLPSATPLPPPPPSPMFSARLLHCLTCLVELCGNCPATPALAADLLGLAWLLREPASDSRELRR